MEEEKIVKMLRQDDSSSDKKNFDLKVRTVKVKEKCQDNGHFPILVGEERGELKKIFIKGTSDQEIDKYKCRVMANYLIRNNVKSSDIEVTSVSNGIVIRGKSKTGV